MQYVISKIRTWFFWICEEIRGFCFWGKGGGDVFMIDSDLKHEDLVPPSGFRGREWDDVRD